MDDASDRDDDDGRGKDENGNGDDEQRSNAGGSGYKNPPIKNRFPPGKSGNPRGRPKGALGLKAELQAELNEYVTITVDGKQKRIRKRRLIIKALAARAAKGDVKAAEKLLALVIQAEGFEPEAPIKRRFTDNDQQILDQFLGEPDGTDAMSVEPKSASAAGEQINDKDRAMTADGDTEDPENEDDEK